MIKLRLNFKGNLKILKLLILGYIVFAGCFIFPFSNERSSFDVMKAYLVIGSYLVIGIGLGIIFGKQKYKFVYISSLLLTMLGMVLRYLLEYGEVSNTMNFILLNIILYLSIVPIFMTLVYHMTIRNVKIMV
ncbi:hypothetical protein [Proteiniclasticum sp.]|uniref:hypothetical protein n=1 Tax=Proteiniclasticum sp. TaxID=2053595 RepID=UPI0028A1C546|nr:hypothetical protein [Proteiniclasticum sp.]